MKRTISSLLALLAFTTPALSRADLIKQSSAYPRIVLMTSSTDRITGAAGLTLTVKISKAGGAFATITPTVTDLTGGRYAIALTSADTGTIGPLDLQVTATNADPTDSHDQVVAFDPGDAAALGLSRIDAAVSSRSTPAQAQAGATAAIIAAFTFTGSAVNSAVQNLSDIWSYSIENGVTAKNVLQVLGATQGGNYGSGVFKAIGNATVSRVQYSTNSQTGARTMVLTLSP